MTYSRWLMKLIHHWQMCLWKRVMSFCVMVCCLCCVLLLGYVDWGLAQCCIGEHSLIFCGCEHTLTDNASPGCRRAPKHTRNWQKSSWMNAVHKYLTFRPVLWEGAFIGICQYTTVFYTDLNTVSEAGPLFIPMKAARWRMKPKILDFPAVNYQDLPHGH